MPCVCHREPHLVTLILSNQGTRIMERFSDLTATLKTKMQEISKKQIRALSIPSFVLGARHGRRWVCEPFAVRQF